MPSRRRVPWTALGAVAAGAAIGAGVALRLLRRDPRTGPEPAVPEAALRLEESGRPTPAASAERRNWAALIAAPAVAIVVLSILQVATWPTKHRGSVDHARAVPSPSGSTAAGPSGMDPQLDPDVREALLRVSPSAPRPPTPSGSHSINIFAPLPGGFVAVPDEHQRCTTPVAGTPEYRLPAQRSLSTQDALTLAPCKTLVLGTTALIPIDGGSPDSHEQAPPALVEATPVLARFTDLPWTSPPLAKGHHRVTFSLHLRYWGSSSLQLPYVWVFAASQNAGWLYSVDFSIDRFWLGPGQQVDLPVAFDVGKNDRLTRLRLVEGQTVDWVLG